MKIVLKMIIIFSLIIITACSNEKLNSSNEEQYSIKEIDKRLSDLLLELPYGHTVELPTRLPFNGEPYVNAQIEDFIKNSKLLRILYVMENTSIEIEIVDMDIIPGSFDEKIKLQDGNIIHYYDNGILQFLYWQYDGISYKVAANKDVENDALVFSKEDLLDIYYSFK